MKHHHERSLTTLVVLEAVELFVIAPLAAKTRVPFIVEAVVAAAIVAAVSRPSERTETFDFAAALILLVA